MKKFIIAGILSLAVLIAVTFEFDNNEMFATVTSESFDVVFEYDHVGGEFNYYTVDEYIAVMVERIFILKLLLLQKQLEWEDAIEDLERQIEEAENPKIAI